MKDEKFTFTKREIHQFLEKRRLAHDAVLAMVSSGAIKLPCANFSRSIDDDAVEKKGSVPRVDEECEAVLAHFLAPFCLRFFRLETAL